MRLILPVFATLALSVLSVPAQAQEPPIMPEVGQTYEAALAASPTPRRLADQQVVWLSRRDLDAVGEPGDNDRARIAELRRGAAMDRAMRQVHSSSPVPVPGACLGAALVACTSPVGGYLAGPNGAVLYWQLQDGAFPEAWFPDDVTPQGTPGHAIVIAAPASAGSGPIPLIWAFSSAQRLAPHWVQLETRLFVVLPATHGFMNDDEDLVFEWAPTGLTQIDTWSWRADLAEHLPPDLTLPRHVAYDLSDLSARTPVWIGDGDTPDPAGGDATLQFSLEGDRLALTTVRVRDPLLDDIAPILPVDLYAHVSRRLECARLPGSIDRDAERRARLEARVAALDCPTLATEEEALRRAYAGRPMWTTVLDRLDARGR